MAASLAEFAAYIMYFAIVGLVGYYVGYGVSVSRELRRRHRRG